LNNHKLSDHNYDTDFKNSKINGYKCLICNIVYKHTQSLTNHKKLKHYNYDLELNEINKKLEIDQLKEIFIKESFDNKQKIEKLMKDLEEEKNKRVEIITKTSKAKTINNTTNNNTTNNNNGIINNVTIVGFGKEDYNKLNSDEIYKILCDITRDPLTTSIEMIHFNKRLPQYQNIRLKDIKSKYIDIHNGSEWQKQSKSNIIEETLDNHMYNIKSLKEEYPNKSKIKKSISRLVDNYDKHYDLDTEDKNLPNNKKLAKELNKQKDNICLTLHNKVNKSVGLNETKIMDV
jgi:hypothetical protein